MSNLGSQRAAVLDAELGATLAAAAVEPTLRHPPWLGDEAAKTLFIDVSLKELAATRDAWKKKTGLAKEREVPPLLMTKTATGMVILHEGRPGAAVSADGVVAPLTVEEMRGAVTTAAMPSVAAKAAAEASARAAKETSEREASAARRAAAKRIIRFKYSFRPPPWTLDKGVRRKKNAAAAAAAGVKVGQLRLPVAPSHHRYIEILEDEVSALASEVEERKKMLLAKIDRFLNPLWRPPGAGAAKLVQPTLSEMLGKSLQAEAAGGGAASTGGGAASTGDAASNSIEEDEEEQDEEEDEIDAALAADYVGVRLPQAAPANNVAAARE